MSGRRRRIIAWLGMWGLVALLFWRQENTIDQVQKERLARATAVNQVIEKECQKDALRDAVIVQALHDAQDRARASLAHVPMQQKQEVEKIQKVINQLTPIKACQPPPIIEIGT